MNYIRILLLIFLMNLCNGLIDPISVGIVSGLAALGGYNYQTVAKYTVCKVMECCIDEYIPVNIDDLQNDLKTDLYGQHIVIEHLIPALRGHFSKNSKPKKPLVISFHGTSGTGKNYVAEFIAKNLYKKGVESKFVHKFSARLDFPLASESENYKKFLSKKVLESLKACSNSLFIFDEVDKMPPGVFESISSILDHHSYVKGYDFRKSVFILLSNTAGLEISNQLSKIMRQGTWREYTKLHDFERILELNAYNEDGGLKRSSIIESNLIDHFIPFLPLEKLHVKQCIESEFKRLNTEPEQEIVEHIIANYITFESSGLFATSGCKRIHKKVEIEVYSKVTSDSNVEISKV